MITVAYLRVSTRSQDLANQKLAILEFSQKRRFTVDEFIEARISSRKSPLERRMRCIPDGRELKHTEVQNRSRSLALASHWERKDEAVTKDTSRRPHPPTQGHEQGPRAPWREVSSDDAPAKGTSVGHHWDTYWHGVSCHQL